MPLATYIGPERLRDEAVLLPPRGKSVPKPVFRNHPNQLLARLATGDFALLEPHLASVSLKPNQKLETPNQLIEHVYFIRAGIVSVVSTRPNTVSAEVGLIGMEGVTGASVILGNGQSPYASYAQGPASADRLDVDALRAAMAKSASLQRLLLRFVRSLMIQTAATAVANAGAKLSERLARWVLMAQDRTGGSNVLLTHEFLATMLQVRRASVTETLQDLQDQGLVAAKRGQIAVLDRAGLETVAGDFYGTPEREYRRLIG